MPRPTSDAITTGLAVVAPLVSAISAWLEGRAPEPPALVHLGIPKSELAVMRAEAKAAQQLKE